MQNPNDEAQFYFFPACPAYSIIDVFVLSVSKWISVACFGTCLEIKGYCCILFSRCHLKYVKCVCVWDIECSSVEFYVFQSKRHDIIRDDYYYPPLNYSRLSRARSLEGRHIEVHFLRWGYQLWLLSVCMWMDLAIIA